MNAPLAVIGAALWLMVGLPDYQVYIAPQVRDEWDRLGPVGDWIGCAYGRVQGDSVMIGMQVPALVEPEGVRCPLAMLETDTVVRAIGTVHPLPTRTTECGFSASERAEFQAGKEQVRVRWCGGMHARVLAKRIPPPRATKA